MRLYNLCENDYDTCRCIQFLSGINKKETIGPTNVGCFKCIVPSIILLLNGNE